MIEARFQRVVIAIPNLAQRRQGRVPVHRVLGRGVGIHPPLVRQGRPFRRAADITIARRLAQQRPSRVEIPHQAPDDVDTDVALLVIQVVLGVVGNILPHPIRLEVVVGPEEDRLAPDAGGLRVVDLTRLLGAHLGQQAQRVVGARHALVDLAPLLVQIVLYLSRGPEVRLDLENGRLVAQVGPLVGVAARDAAPHPVRGGAAPRPDGARAAVERPVGGDQHAFDAARVRQGVLIEHPLRGCVQEIFAGVGDADHQGHDRRPDRQFVPVSRVHRLAIPQSLRRAAKT